MATLRVQDGVDLHFTERGFGPLVVIVVHWSGHPTVFEALAADLCVDHRVVTYDARGTGQSTQAGPH
ncbi:MAG TPA: hypothetical protein VHE14_00915, partial [Solirubrobacteraceae bacterium]|nr:hypothetical protein [Solirubrobacteraceae bacterium]